MAVAKKARSKRKGNSRRKMIRKKKCAFCEAAKDMFDFKDVDQLSRFMTERGKIVPRKISGNCAKHQRMLSRVVKRSRHAGLLPFVVTAL